MNNVVYYIIYVVIIILWRTKHIVGDCTTEYKFSDCKVDIYCLDIINLQYDFINQMYYELEPYACGNNYKINLKLRKNNNNKNNAFNFVIPELSNLIEELNLSSNRFTDIEFLPHLENLKTLNVSFNDLSTALLCYDHKFNSLEVLDLSHNSINVIDINEDCTLLTNLKYLNLAHNYIVTLPDAIFSSFSKLKKIFLSNNYIDTLNVITFEGLKKITHLDLSNNRISELDHSLLRFTELKILNLSHNKITGLKKVDFQNLGNILELELGYNLLANIEIDTFEKMIFLKSLDLSHNLLEVLNKDTFLVNNNLTKVDISYNNIQNLPKDIFKGKQMSYFSITDNKLNHRIGKSTFNGLINVSILDLSFQQISELDNYAFLGLTNLLSLKLNNNKINTILQKAFALLDNLLNLDLSNNKLENLNFDKNSLINLKTLIIKNNHLTHISKTDFCSLGSLQYVNIENNSITNVDEDTFESVHDLINLELSNNPLEGELKQNTFKGLILLPSLDISGCHITTAKNNSFDGMKGLIKLNMSSNQLDLLEFNTFKNTSNIDTLDLSNNRLNIFCINTSTLVNLKTLFLNGNNITMIESTTFRNMRSLKNIFIKNNNINFIDNSAFKDQNKLVIFDISYNKNLFFNASIIDSLIYLEKIDLSGTIINAPFKVNTSRTLIDLKLTHSPLINVTTLRLYNIESLNNIFLSNNNISFIDANAFNSLSYLKLLDLSFNKIKYIQPGAFKDNSMLITLNVSHNSLINLNYGVFRGLLYLNTLDLSYNLINSLSSERFYEVTSLNYLIVDYNAISSFDKEDITWGRLKVLSIGDNPLSCDSLRHFKKHVRISVTAITLDHHSENIDGITCNKNNEDTYKETKFNNVDTLPTSLILNELKQFLLNLTKLGTQSLSNTYLETSVNVLKNISEVILKSTSKESTAISESNKLFTDLKYESVNTNFLLNQILISLKENIINNVNSTNINGNNPTIHKFETHATNIEINKTDAANQTDKMHIDMNRQELQLLYEKIKQEIVALKSQLSNISIAIDKKHENYKTEVLASSQLQTSDSNSLVFTNVTIGFILVILLSYIIYRAYNSYKVRSRSWSLSTTEIARSMESPNL